VRIEPEGAGAGEAYVDWLTWDGAPTVTLSRPSEDANMWRRAWVDGVDQFQSRWWDSYRISQNIGTGLISQGTADWDDYTVAAEVTVMLARQAGIAARVGGMRRWYALMLCDDGMVRLVKDREAVETLAEAPLAWSLDTRYTLALTVVGNRLVGAVDGVEVLLATDEHEPLLAGGIGLVVSDGTLGADAVSVTPAG